MSWIFILAVVVVVAAAFLAVAAGKAGARSGVGFPYVPAKDLFSPAERSFLVVLDQVVGPEHRVFGKVRVADLASVKPGLERSARQGALNRVAAKHVDFVVCRASDLSVVCAFELNDRSHASKRAYSVQELQAQFASAIGVTPSVVDAAT